MFLPAVEVSLLANLQGFESPLDTDIVDVSISSFTVRCEGYLLSFSWRYVFLGAVGGKCLEKVYLLVFCLRKVRRMTQRRGNRKKHHPDRFRPAFFSHDACGVLGNQASKKTDKKTVAREIWPCEKRPPVSENRIPYLGQIPPRYT